MRMPHSTANSQSGTERTGGIKYCHTHTYLEQGAELASFRDLVDL